MTQNNIIKNQILALFPDNNNYEITAADMRTYVEAIFNSKEEIIIKIDKMVDLISNNSNIYKDSIVAVTKDDENQSGLYVSKKDQPRSVLDLIKLSFVDSEWSKIPSNIFVDVNSDYIVQKSTEFLYIDTTNNPVQITIPNNLPDNSTIEIADFSSTFDINNVTVIDDSGANIGGNPQLVLSSKNKYIKLIKKLDRWLII